jgi:heterodisulfide reductase subunit D
MADDLLKGKYPLSKSVMEKIYSCTLCGNCTVQCQQEAGKHALDIFEALREECVESGVGPLDAHKVFRTNIEKFGNPYGEPSEKRWEGIPEKYFKETADVLFFVGCTSALRNKQLFLDTLEVLDKLGVNFTLSKDEVCCGSPLLTTGQKKYAKRLAETNKKNFEKLKVKTVITACAGCYRSIGSQYAKHFSLLPDKETLDAIKDKKKRREMNPIEIQHITQFIANTLKSKNLKKLPPVTVTYHDPCHLGRHMGVYEDPRTILKKLPGVNLVEMPRAKENAWCCGAGAGIKSGIKHWALEIAEDRIKEAEGISKENNIHMMLSACPFCERNLSDAVVSLQQKETEKKEYMQVMDIVQFLKQYLNDVE